MKKLCVLFSFGILLFVSGRTFAQGSPSDGGGGVINNPGNPNIDEIKAVVGTVVVGNGGGSDAAKKIVIIVGGNAGNRNDLATAIQAILNQVANGTLTIEEAVQAIASSATRISRNGG